MSDGMEKYGVDEVDKKAESTKVGEDAQGAETCPKCGNPVAHHGEVRVCPKCGTEPFEGEQ